MFDRRREMLKEIESGTNWDCILTDNYNGYLDYERLEQDGSYDEALEKLKNLLPGYYQVFKKITDHRIRKEWLPDFKNSPYELGLFLVGYSIMPITLSLTTLRPQKVIFVVSSDTKELVDDIIEGIKAIDQNYGDSINPSTTELSDLSDPAAVYRTIDSIIKKNPADRKIAVDITGGKKSMVASSFMASANSRRCDIFYVDFEEYDARRRAPIYGTEYLASLPNPAEIFSIADWERIESLFDRYQFVQVLKEIGKVEKNLKKFSQYVDASARKKIDRVKMYAEIYEKWDDYRYPEAKTDFPDSDDALAILRKIRAHYFQRFKYYHESNGKQPFPDANNRAIEDNRGEIYRNKSWLPYYLLDRFENARRREEQGQLQGAFLRFVTLIEFVLVLWAEKEMRDVSDIQDRGRIIFGKILDKFLYSCTKPPIVAGVDIREIKKMKNTRNDLILIHSVRVIGQDRYTRNMLNTARENAFRIIKNLLTQRGMREEDIDRIKCQVRFKKFKELWI